MKYLPWSPLLQSAGLTILVATAIDISLFFALSAVPSVASFIRTNGFLSLVISLAVPFGIGALAIFFTRQFFRQILLGTDTIWALIGCLLLALLIKSWVRPIPALFISGFSFPTAMMLAVGCFTTGRRYWRY